MNRPDEGVRRYASGLPWEAILGYSRTVQARPVRLRSRHHGDRRGAGGCRGGHLRPDGTGLRDVETALELAAVLLNDLVQTRLFLTDASRWREVGRAHAEVFAGMFPVSALPACSL